MQNTDDDLLEILEMQADRLAESFNRIAALEDQVFILLKILSHIDGPEGQLLAGALKLTVNRRHEKGETEIAGLTDSIIKALSQTTVPTKQ